MLIGEFKRPVHCAVCLKPEDKSLGRVYVCKGFWACTKEGIKIRFQASPNLPQAMRADPSPSPAVLRLREWHRCLSIRLWLHALTSQSCCGVGRASQGTSSVTLSESLVLHLPGDKALGLRPLSVATSHKMSGSRLLGQLAANYPLWLQANPERLAVPIMSGLCHRQDAPKDRCETA